MGWKNKKPKEKKGKIYFQKKSIYTNEKKSPTGISIGFNSINDLTLKDFLRLNFLPFIFIIYAIIIVILVLAFMM